MNGAEARKALADHFRIAELTEAVEDARLELAAVEALNAAALAIVRRMVERGVIHYDDCVSFGHYDDGDRSLCDCTADVDLAAVRDALDGDGA